MTTSTHILIITLICLILISLSLLTIMGKLDRWYSWSQADNDKPSEQRIARWRRAFAIEILIATAVIVVLNATDIFDEYASYLFIALGAAGAMIERGWIRKV
jgi:archaellum biogenesis protein FlaJ (TadC family)